MIDLVEEFEKKIREKKIKKSIDKEREGEKKKVESENRSIQEE